MVETKDTQQSPYWHRNPCLASTYFSRCIANYRTHASPTMYHKWLTPATLSVTRQTDTVTNASERATRPTDEPHESEGPTTHMRESRGERNRPRTTRWKQTRCDRRGHGTVTCHKASLFDSGAPQATITYDPPIRCNVSGSLHTVLSNFRRLGLNQPCVSKSCDNSQQDYIM